MVLSKYSNFVNLVLLLCVIIASVMLGYFAGTYIATDACQKHAVANGCGEYDTDISFSWVSRVSKDIVQKAGTVK